MTVFPILTTIIFLPTLGAALLVLVPARREALLRWGAMGTTGVVFLLAVFLLRLMDLGSGDLQLMERAAWLPALGIQYLLGVDGISLLMVLLTAFLMPLALFASFGPVKTRLKEYLISFLVLETGMLGTFLALDIILFYVFWELMLIPMALIIGIWGGARRVYAAVKFFLFTLGGSLFMLLGFLLVYFAHASATGTGTFDLTRLVGFPFPAAVQHWAFWALFLGFAVKVPLFPLHTWLPDAHVEAPTAGSVILAGVLLKMGAYGFLRFSLPLLPAGSAAAVPALAVLSVVGIVYGALVAWRQADVKKLVAYSSVSHMGFVILGVFSLTIQGVQGGVLQMVNHGLSTGALFLLVGVLYERRHTRMMDQFGGLARPMPAFAAVLGLTAFSSIGLPGLNGFVGEILILAGTFQGGMYAFGALAALGIILGAVYMLHLLQKVLFGPVTLEENRRLPDLTWREKAVLVPILALFFWIGLYPKPFLDIAAPAVDKLVGQMDEVRFQGHLLDTASNPFLSQGGGPGIEGLVVSRNGGFRIPNSEFRKRLGQPPPPKMTETGRFFRNPESGIRNPPLPRVGGKRPC